MGKGERRGKGMKNEREAKGEQLWKKSDIETSAYIGEKVVYLCDNGHLVPSKLSHHTSDTNNGRCVRRYDTEEVGEATLVWQCYISSCVADLKNRKGTE